MDDGGVSAREGEAEILQRWVSEVNGVDDVPDLTQRRGITFPLEGGGRAATGSCPWTVVVRGWELLLRQEGECKP